MLLKQMKYFITVVDLHSFTEAAEQCFISQSAISQQIKALEKELGVRLFERSKRQFSLTAAGEYFYRHGKVLLDEIEDFKEETIRRGEDQELNLTIGYPKNFSTNELLETIVEFKNINENFGVKYGDVVLKQVGNCIKKLLTKNQQLYRIVADEFIVMDVVGSKEDARALYNAIRRSITCYVESINYDIYLTISAGILDFHDYPNKSYNSIMQWTEFALNQSKINGKNTYTIFKQEAYQEFLRKNKLTKELHKAVNQQFKGFEVYFQPIIDMKTEKIHSMEALLRFECDEFGKISPLEFIPLLEESDLIIPVGRWVLDQALKAVSMFSNIKVQINMSYVQVLKTPALNDILNIIKNYKIENNQLVIELTESGFIESNKNFIDFCNGLKKENILLALDDFGTGYSNFHYLYNLKPDYIKIDRTLMKNALSNEYENMLLKHMVDMAHSVGVKICIEGIEEKEELERIMLLKPDYIQGFYYGRPVSLSVFMESYEI